MNNDELDRQTSEGRLTDEVARVCDQESFQALLFNSFLHQQKRARDEVGEGHRLRAIAAILQGLTDAAVSEAQFLNMVAVQAVEATGATGAAIALNRDGEMVCCASSGATSPLLGARLSQHSGISGECLRTANTLICENAAGDERVNREAARQLGIGSMVVVPVLRRGVPTGVFELFASQPGAFEQCDVFTAEVLAGLLQLWMVVRSEQELRQALEAERGAVLKVLEEITPTLEKAAGEEQKYPEPLLRPERSVAANLAAVPALNASLNSLARTLAAQVIEERH